VEQAQYLFAPSMTFDLGRGVGLSAGPEVQYTTTKANAGRLVSVLQPYGSEDYGQVGGRLALEIERRDVPANPRKGAMLAAAGRVFPSLWGVRGTFGEVHGEASTYLTAGSGPTLGLRAGGKRVWGDYPFHEAAYLGGADTVRGLRAQRFAGDGALFGNAELRMALGRFSLLLPGDVGLFALGDVGRVFLKGESSRTWHTAVGGGVWLSFLERANTLSLAVARSEERTGLYVSAGFLF
jgi:hemolysin activation/secretion protein